jgi:ACR3 family arsenite efflux pump ArsB
LVSAALLSVSWECAVAHAHADLRLSGGEPDETLAYLLMRRFKVPHNVASPGALIGASNFFELAVAVAITLFGPTSPAALATVVGVLVEVPVMLSVCKVCNRSRRWYERRLPETS